MNDQLPPPDDQEMPDSPVEPDEPASAPEEVCVPLSAVAVNEDENASTPPDVGDEITVTLGGKVTRVEGSMVYFNPATANGEPIPANDDSGQDQPADQSATEEDSLRAMI